MHSLLKRAALTLSLLLLSDPAHAITHAPFDALLKKHVKRGKVDYEGIKATSQAQLDAHVAAVGKTRIGGMSRSTKLAFYLNAYNALVIKGVVDRLPNFTTVMKVKGFFDKHKHLVAGKRVTLNQLENKIIRPTFKDARIHFALVCGARSCPPLRAAAFRTSGLDGVLERLARNFINSGHGVQVKGDAVKVSQLFKWYAADFKQASGSVGKYLARYHKKHADKLSTAKLGYLHYSWALNKK